MWITNQYFSPTWESGSQVGLLLLTTDLRLETIKFFF